ncbi:TolC family protein [Chitinispirillales bacterium ANBcel5]|uniref:TolC family protein n=1 Tax=Cellulosispirillum alkaliphilum TaxID=3039283 RepID=UPI002A53EBEB|nr:TolC family protein [Chitinispirillales bacterium ANBcel5]
MVRTKVTLLILLVIGVSGAREYTLDWILRGAFSTSHELRAIEQEMYKADAQVSEVIGTAFPEVSASFNLSHSLKQYTPSIPEFMETGFSNDSVSFIQQIPQRASLLNEPGGSESIMRSLTLPKQNSASVSLSITQPLYSQGKVAIGVRSAKLQQSMLMCRYQEARLRVKGNTTMLFYSTLVAQNNVEIEHENLELAQKAHDLAVLRYEVGVGSELDTLTSKLHLENAYVDLAEAESDLKIAYETLIRRSGSRTSVADFSVKGEIPNHNYDLTLQDAMERMDEYSPVLSEFRGAAELADERVKFARSDYHPVLFAGASLSRVGQFDDFDNFAQRETWFDDHRVFIGATWTIFSGMQRTYRLRQAHMDRSVVYLRKMENEQNFEIKMKSAYERFKNSQRRLQRTVNIQKLADRGHSVAALSYENGLVTILELRNAQLEVKKARIAHNSALLDYHAALIELKILMGDNNF